MNDWFTVEAIDDETFAISEDQHWEEPHCYLLCGREKALLIDTGLGVAPIGEVVNRLTDVPVTVATTHVHWDHIGGHGDFCPIAVHELEQDWLNGKFPIPLEAVRHQLTQYPCAFPAGFDPDAYQVFQGKPDVLLRDGDLLKLGGREIQVVHTPGHSPGHCCFYERARGYLFAGDLIYKGCLYAFYPTTDPVRFYHSVERVRALTIMRIFPGHHQLHIPASMADEIAAGFTRIERSGKLRQGSGLFTFRDFQIRI